MCHIFNKYTSNNSVHDILLLRVIKYMVISHLRVRRYSAKRLRLLIVLKTNKFKAQFGPKIKRHAVVARGTYTGVLYLKLLSTDHSLCMPSFMLLTQSARFVGLTAPLFQYSEAVMPLRTIVMLQDPLGPHISDACALGITVSQHRHRTFQKSPALIFSSWEKPWRPVQLSGWPIFSLDVEKYHHTPPNFIVGGPPDHVLARQ